MSRLFVWLLGVLIGCPLLAWAQEAEDQAQSPAVDAALASPRAVVQGFLETINGGDATQAATYLDLSHLPKPVASAKGADYATQLKGVLDRIWRIDLNTIPDNPDTSSPFRLGEALGKQAELTNDRMDDAARIQLVRAADGNWRFARDTVDAVDELWSRWAKHARVEGLLHPEAQRTFSLWLRDQFPHSLRKTHFLLPDYQWLSLLGLIFLGFVVDMLVRRVLYQFTKIWFRYLRGNGEIEFDTKLYRPVGLLAQALVWYVGTTLIGLPSMALAVLLIGLKFFTLVAGIWTAFAMINLLTVYLMKRADATATKFDDLLIPLVSKSLKVFVVCIGVLSGADAFGLPLTGLIGGTAIGGLALAMASKDAVSNLFGSVTVLVDRPFEVGDWIIMQDAEGSVETVGFRSTRIRTFYNSLITVPNSLLTTAVVDNMGRRRYRRIKTTLGLQYDTTPEQIDAFCEGVRELIRRHPYTRKDYYHVYLNQFSGSSLDVLLYCFLECPDWSVELRERHRLFVDIIRLAKSLGCQFAFPTRTLHMFQEQAADQPVEIGDTKLSGRREAAQIAGPLQTPDRRPGTVEFHGPVDVEDLPRGEDSGE